MATFWQAARGWLHTRVESPAIAEELASEAVTRILSARQRNSNVRHWTGYAWRCVHNVLIDHYRERDRRPAADLGDWMIAPDGHFDRANLREDLSRLLHHAQLTPEQATVVELRYLQGWPFADIAERLDSTEGAIKALQHRAIAKLREVATALGR